MVFLLYILKVLIKYVDDDDKEEVKNSEIDTVYTVLIYSLLSSWHKFDS